MPLSSMRTTGSWMPTAPSSGRWPRILCIVTGGFGSRLTMLSRISATLRSMSNYRARKRCADRINLNYAGLGRNCPLLESLRQRVYVLVKKFWRPAGQQPFQDWLLKDTEALNQQFPTLLHFSEMKRIARSVGRWARKRFTPGAFRDLPAARGRASGSEEGSPVGSSASKRRFLLYLGCLCELWRLGSV